MTPLSIWVVEDHWMNQQLFRDVLEVRGHRVTVLATAGEAQALAREGCAPDLALIDLMLPDVDGVRLLRDLQSRPEWCDIPCVAVTAQAMGGDGAHLLAQGFADYLPKPVDTRRLPLLVEELARAASRGESPDREAP